MATFLANNLIKGKIKWSQVQSKYPQYCEDTEKVLDGKGYMIDEDGNCVKKPVDE